MSQFRQIAPDFAVSVAPGPGFFADAKAAGFALVVNNRPDGEDPTQLSSAEAAAAAKAAGLAYVHIPVSGMPGPDQAEALKDVLTNAAGPVLAYCRSGTRSAATYALAQAMRGASVDDTLAAVRGAGYELGQLAPLMERLAP